MNRDRAKLLLYILKILEIKRIPVLASYPKDYYLVYDEKNGNKIKEVLEEIVGFEMYKDDDYNKLYSRKGRDKGRDKGTVVVSSNVANRVLLVERSLREASVKETEYTNIYAAKTSEGKYISIYHIPENTTIEGDLDLVYTKIKSLPKVLKIKGNLNIKNTDIKRSLP